MNKKSKTLKNQKVISVKEFWEQYFTNKKTFDSKNPVFVAFNADFNMGEKSVADNQEGLIPITAKAYHDQTNLNGSTITTDIFQEKTESIVFRPILANIVETDEGVKDFGAHDFTFVEDGEGGYELSYQEKPIGVITKYSFEFDEVNKVNRAVTQGYLYEEYSGDALKILERRGAVDCSVELMVRDCHFDDANSTLCLDDYYVSGLTLLGAEHEPGMAGSNASISQSSEEVTVEISLNEEGKVNNALPEQIGPKNPSLTTRDDEVEEELIIDEVEQAEKEAELQAEPVAVSEEPVEEVSEPETEQHELDDTDGTQKDILENSEHLDASLQEELEALKAELEKVRNELSEYKTKEENALKEEIVNDPLYAPYLENETFSEVLSKKDEMTANDLKKEMALAFTQVMRNEETPKTITAKRFGKNPNLQVEENSRYGKIFSRIQDKRRK